MAKTRASITPLNPTSDLSPQGVVNISDSLRPLLADVFALYVKTKSFHWHIGGAHFAEYHALLDTHATELLTMTDEIAERARKIGGTTIRSIGDIARHQCIEDNNADHLSATDMLSELRADNQQLTRSLRATHEICDRHRDVATASLIENWIDHAERRAWFLAETLRAD
jgi:starvation-inducible DNA-binding protein